MTVKVIFAMPSGSSHFWNNSCLKIIEKIRNRQIHVFSQVWNLILRLHVCIYAYLYFMHGSVFVCVCMWECLYEYMYGLICICVFTCVWLYEYACAYMCVCVFTSVCMYTYMCLWVKKEQEERLNRSACIHAYMCVYIVCMCVYIWGVMRVMRQNADRKWELGRIHEIREQPGNLLG